MKHKHAKLSDCGLFLDVASPFIGASPDRIISWDCCPDACLEVKCPYSINFKSPHDPDAKLSYLIYKDNEFYLNRNHKYFTQCQMQLGVTGLKKCYFMVWTCHGFIVDEICFDSTLWEYLKQLYREFYNHYLLSFYKN